MEKSFPKRLYVLSKDLYIRRHIEFPATNSADGVGHLSEDNDADREDL